MNEDEISSDDFDDEMTQVCTCKRDQISALKKAIEERDKKIWQLEANLKIEKEMGDKFEDLLKSEQERYMKAESELEIIKREIIKSQQFCKCRERAQKMQTGNKALEKHDRRAEMIEEKVIVVQGSQCSIKEMRKQLEIQNKELTESKKALEEVTTEADAERKRIQVVTNELQKCQTLIEEMQHGIEILKTESKLKADEAIEVLNEKEKQLEDKISIILEKEIKMTELERIAKNLELKLSNAAKEMESEIATSSHKLQELTQHLEKQETQKELIQNELVEKERFSKRLQDEINKLKTETRVKELELQKLDQLSKELEKVLDDQKLKTNDLENRLKAKETEFEDLKVQLENRKIIIESQLDRINLLEKSVRERETSIERSNKELKEFQSAMNGADIRLKQLEKVTEEISLQLEQEMSENQSKKQVISELQRNILYLENELNQEIQLAARTKAENENRESKLLLEKETLIQSLKDLHLQFELEKKMHKTELQEKEKLVKVLQEEIETLRDKAFAKEAETKKLTQDLEDQEIYSEKLKTQMEKEFETFHEKHSLKTIELQDEVRAKEFECKTLTKELDVKNTVIDSQKNKIETLEKSVFERESSIDRINEELFHSHSTKFELENRLKELVKEKVDISLQLQGELRSERKSSNLVINELRKDIRELESKLDHEKQSVRRATEDTGALEVKMHLEKQTLSQDLKDLQLQFETEEKMHMMKLQEKEQVEKDLREEIETLRNKAFVQDVEIKTLTQNLTDQEMLTEKLKERIEKEFETFLENHSLKINELQDVVRAKECECKDLTEEVDVKNSVIDSQQGKIEILEMSVFERESSIDRVKEEIIYLHDAKSEWENRFKQSEEEKLDVSLQLREELRRERKSNQLFINELRADIRELENKVDLEKQSALKATEETEAKERKINFEKQTLIQSLEDLQLQLESEKERYTINKQKFDSLQVKAKEMTSSHEAELHSVEDVCRKLQKQNEELQKQIEKYEDLQKQLENKNEILALTEVKCEELLNEREIEKIEMKSVTEEKNLLMESLRRELSEIKEKMEDESLQSESNRINEENLGKVEFTHEVRDLTIMAIEQAKRDIEAESNLNETLKELADAKESSTSSSMDEGENEVSEKNTDFPQTLKDMMCIPLIFLTLSFLCLCLWARVTITTAMTIVPLVYVFICGAIELYRIISLKNCLRKEKLRLCGFSDAVQQLVKQLAIERTLTDCLTNTVEDLKAEASEVGRNCKSHLRELITLKEKKTKVNKELQKRQELIEKLQTENNLGKEKGATLDELNRQQQDDTKHVEHLENVICKLEILLGKKWNKNFDFYYKYEELKKEVNTMTEERIMTQNLLRHEFENRRNRDEVGTNLQFKAAAILVITILCAAMLACSTQYSSAQYAVGSSLFCTVIALLIWKKRNVFQSLLDCETETERACMQEIKELSALLEQEYEVIGKQRETISALETILKLKQEKKEKKTPELNQHTLISDKNEESDNVTCLGESVSFEDKIGTNLERPRKHQKETSAPNKEGQYVVGVLEQAPSQITLALTSAKLQLKREEFLPEKRDKFHKVMLNWKSIYFISTCFIVSLGLVSFKMYRISLAIVFMSLGFVFPAVYHYLSPWIGGINDERQNVVETTNPNMYSRIKQTLDDVIFAILVVTAELSIQLPHAFLRGLASILIIVTSLVYRRKLYNYIMAKDKLVIELTNERSQTKQLCEIYCDEVETVKKLLVLERSCRQDSEIKQLRVNKSDCNESESNFGGHDEELIAMIEDVSGKLEAAKTEEFELNEMLMDEKLLGEVKEDELERQSKDVHGIHQVGDLPGKSNSVGLETFEIKNIISDTERQQGVSVLQCKDVLLREQIKLLGNHLSVLKEEAKRMTIKGENGEKEPVSKIVEQCTNHLVTIDELRMEIEREGSNENENLCRIQVQNKLQQKDETDKRRRNLVDSISEDFRSQKLQEQIELHRLELQRLKMELKEGLRCRGHAKLQQLKLDLEKQKRKIKEAKLILDYQKKRNSVSDEVVAIQREKKTREICPVKVKKKREPSVAPGSFLGPRQDVGAVADKGGEMGNIGDLKGILFWLGKNAENATEWSNPADSYLIHIIRSSDGHGKATDVAGRKLTPCSTANKPHQWWRIDFGQNRSISPVAYNIVHGWSERDGALRYWVFEGSSDGRNWDILHHHENDKTLNCGYAVGVWKLSRKSAKSYRFLRVRQTGFNASGSHVLFMCGVEVYGKLLISK